jgi:hypothetical protein
MLFSLSYTTLLAAFTYTTIAQASPVAPNRLTVRDVQGPVVPGEYIVKLKKSANRSAHISSLPFAFSVLDTLSPILQDFAEDFFDGYAGNFSAADLDAILASPDVDYVEPNVIVSLSIQLGLYLLYRMLIYLSISSLFKRNKPMPLGVFKASALKHPLEVLTLRPPITNICMKNLQDKA